MASSSYSPLSSILKSSRLNVPSKKTPQTQMQVRFDSAVTIDVVSILKDYIEGTSDAKYVQLLNLKNDPNVNVSCFWWCDWKNFLTEKLFDFSRTLFYFSFFNKSTKLSAYLSLRQSFLLTLCWAFPGLTDLSMFWANTWFLFKL